MTYPLTIELLFTPEHKLHVNVSSVFISWVVNITQKVCTGLQIMIMGHHCIWSNKCSSNEFFPHPRSVAPSWNFICKTQQKKGMKQGERDYRSMNQIQWKAYTLFMTLLKS